MKTGFAAATRYDSTSTMSDNDIQLIEASLQDFSKEIQTALPLRHFAQFYDVNKLKEVTEQKKICIMKKFFSKVWNRDREEVVALLRSLHSRMNKEVIPKMVKKNWEHKTQSIGYLQKRVEAICDEFKEAMEAHLQMNPDIGLDSLKEYLNDRKLFAASCFEGMWKPENAQIQETRKLKMERQISMTEDEVLEKQKVHLERKSVDEGKDVFQEVRSIVLEKSRQLKCYVNDQEKRVSNRRLKSKVEGIKEYLVNGKGFALRAAHEEIYSKLVEAVDSEVEFLTDKVEGNALSPEETIGWAERFDVKLKSYCFGKEGETDPALGPQQETNELDYDAPARGITLQLILKEDPFDLWDCEEPELETRTDQGTVPDNQTETGEGRCDVSDEVAEIFTGSKAGPDPDPATANIGLRRRRRNLFSSRKCRDSDDHSKVGAAATPGVAPSKKRRMGEEVSSGVITRRRSSRITKICDTAPRTSARGTMRTVHDPVLNMNKIGRVEVQVDEAEEHNADTEDVSVSSPNVSQLCTRNREGESDIGPTKKLRNSRRNAKKFLEKISILKGDPITYLCKVCKKTFRCRTYVLRFHGDYCGIPKERPFICAECDKRFPTEFHYLQHVRVHSGDKPFQCPKCPTRFSLKSHLAKHIRSHDRGIRFVCKTCNASFVSQNRLHDHNLSHVDKLWFPCSYCDKRFSCLIQLKRHLVAHSGLRPFKCPSCEFSFFAMTYLYRHIHAVHRQPKRIARRLAQESAADYLKKETNKSYSEASFDKIYSSVVSHVIKKAKLQVPDKVHATNDDSNNS